MKKQFFINIDMDEFKQILSEAFIEHSNAKSKSKESKQQVKQLLTQKEVLSLLKVSLPTLLSWRRLGIIQVIKINRSVRYRKEDVDKLLERLPSIKYSRNLGGVSY